MQRSATTSRSSDKQRIVFQDDSRDDAASRGLSLYSPMLKKERPQPVMPERLIHCVPIILMLCFLLLRSFSSPVESVTTNGVIEGVQGNEMMANTFKRPLVNSSILMLVFTSLAPAPQKQKVFGANSL